MLKRILATILGTAVIASSAAAPQLMEGGLYVTPQDGGTYTALKILKLDDHGVHIRLYSNVFTVFPKSIDESTLYMAGIDKKEGEPLGMGHLPISKQSFPTWGAILVQQSSVSPDELEGYQMWLEAEGGYF